MFKQGINKITLFVVVVLVVVIGIYSFTKAKDPVLPSSKSDNSLIANEIHNFPIFPGSKFMKKELTGPCPSPKITSYTDCGSVAYRWVSTEDTKKVQEWYHGEDVKKLGWKMLGGAGSVGSFTTESWKDGNGNSLTLQVSSNMTDVDPYPYNKTTVSIIFPLSE